MGRERQGGRERERERGGREREEDAWIWSINSLMDERDDPRSNGTLESSVNVFVRLQPCGASSSDEAFSNLGFRFRQTTFKFNRKSARARAFRSSGAQSGCR